VSDDQGPDLPALAAEVAAGLEDVEVSGDGGVVVYQRKGSVFARVTSDALELRLPEDIAEAAVRTSDTLAVPGRGGWVRLVPAEAERHVVDRARAWFQTAWRHAREHPGE
jgi:hypothetical protein